MTGGDTGQTDRPLKLLVLSTQFAGLGGVEAILRGHHQHDARFGIDSRFSVFWEPEHPGWPRAKFLDFQNGMTIRDARKRVKNAFPDFQPDIAIYHTVWGWPFFADLHGARKNILYLHSDTPGLAQQLNSRVWWADAFVCVSDTLIDRVKAARPGIPDDRFLRVDAAIEVPDGISAAPRPRGRPFVIGFCGRIAKEQKRVDRFPELVAKLEARKIPFRLEFLGDGSERAWLEEALPDRSRCVFHGKKSGADYWRILNQWDSILFVSDYEGTPLALLEGMAAGAVPLHPDLGSGGDHYAQLAHPKLVYPPGDLDALVERIGWLASLDDSAFDALRAAAGKAITPHLGDTYRVKFTDFVRRINALPPLEKRPLPRRLWPTDWLTFSMTARIGDFKKRLRGG